MANKPKAVKPMEFKVWLDPSGFFKMKFRGDPKALAEGLGSLMVQNEMLNDIVNVSVKVRDNYIKVENESKDITEGTSATC